MQFKKGFEIYEELWAKLVDLRIATHSLRAVFDFHDPKESDQERKNRRIKEFADKFNNFIVVVEKNRPFYPDEVYSEIQEVAKTARKENIEYQYMTGKSEDFEKAEKNINIIFNHIDNVCKEIRKRIDTVLVVD